MTPAGFVKAYGFTSKHVYRQLIETLIPILEDLKTTHAARVAELNQANDELAALNTAGIVKAASSTPIVAIKSGCEAQKAYVLSLRTYLKLKGDTNRQRELETAYLSGLLTDLSSASS